MQFLIGVRCPNRQGRNIFGNPQAVYSRIYLANRIIFDVRLDRSISSSITSYDGKRLRVRIGNRCRDHTEAQNGYQAENQYALQFIHKHSPVLM